MMDFLNNIDLYDGCNDDDVKDNAEESVDFEVLRCGQQQQQQDDYIRCDKCAYPCFTHEHLLRHKKNCNKDDKDKRFSCSLCLQKFSTKRNCLLHEQRCPRQSFSSSLKRPGNDDVGVSTTNKEPKIETTTTSTRSFENIIVEDGAGKREGIAAEKHAEYWKLPTLHESAFNGKVVTYKKDFDTTSKVDLLDRMKNVFRFYEMEIYRKLLESNTRAWKYYFSTLCHFHKLSNEEIVTDPPVTFRTEVFKINNDTVHKLKRHIDISLLHIWHQIE